MELILFRHGIAEDRQPGTDDADRRLTDEGIDKTQRAAEGLAKIAPRPDIILSSPKIRALLTAQIAGEVLGSDVLVVDALAGSDVPRMLATIAKHDEQTIMIVGHEPDFSEIIETLVFGRMTDTVEMKKAGAALVDVAGGIRLFADSESASRKPVGILRWLIPPKALRRMA